MLPLSISVNFIFNSFINFVVLSIGNAKHLKLVALGRVSYPTCLRLLPNATLSLSNRVAEILCIYARTYLGRP